MPPCSCEPCRTAEYRYDKQRRVDAAQGRPRTRDAAPTAAIIEALAAAGMTYSDIATAAGCAEASIYNYRRPGARIGTRIANAIAAIRPSISASTVVPALGAARRIQACVALGHPESTFVAESGLAVCVINDIATGRLETVRAETFDRVDVAYQRLSAIPPRDGAGATWARRRAAGNGWPTPRQWDGEIDNPDANPSTWARTSPLKPAEVVAEAEEISEWTGQDWHVIASRLGVRPDTLHQYRTRERRRQEAAAS